MTQQPQTKKTTVRKKKRLLNKLPANLPAYNYEAFSYKDMQRAVSYFQAELAKIEKLLSKLPNIGNQQETKVSQPVANPYMDIYGTESTYPNQVKQQLSQPQVKQSKPELVAPALPYQPYQPGMQGEHMEMPSILGSSGVVINTLKDNEQPFNGVQAPVETAKLPIVEDNSAELEADLRNLINPTN